MDGNFIKVADEKNGIVKNAYVYNLGNAVRAAKFPMSANLEMCTEEIKDITRKLGKANRGTGHDNFLHGILVGFDLTLSNKAWVEWERYHFQDIVSSQSTMHRVSKIGREDSAFNEYVTELTKAEIKRLIKEYEEAPDLLKNDAYLRLLYNVPSGLKLTAGIVTNYGQLKTMYNQRKGHRLPEWRNFCKWLETLPRFSELTACGM